MAGKFISKEKVHFLSILLNTVIGAQNQHSKHHDHLLHPIDDEEETDNDDDENDDSEKVKSRKTTIINFIFQIELQLLKNMMS